jgi:geranylgeranyl diphosphate synthase type I
MPLPDLATIPYASAVGVHSDLAAVDAAILDAVDQLPPGIRAVAGYHLGFTPTVDAYLEMAEGKTGALTGAACELAATLAGAPPVVVEALERFGRHAGVAFRIADDVLGIQGDNRRTGKPVGSDLAARKKTLPVVAALHAADAEAGELHALLDTGVPLSQAQTRQATVLVGRLGGRTTAEAIAQQHLDLALEALHCCDLPAAAREELRTMAQHMAARSC